MLPDIIKMSVVNLSVLSNMNKKSKNDFLERFNKSMNINLKQEFNYNRAVASGRR